MLPAAGYTGAPAAAPLIPRRSLATIEALAPGLNLSVLSQAQLEAMAEALHELQLAQARGEPVPVGLGLRTGADCFIEYAIGNELTDEPISNGAHHIAWHDHLNAHRLAVVMAPVGHGKTQQIAVGRVVYELGRNPNLRIGIISNAAEAAEKVLASISQHILENARVREVFPHLRPHPNKALPWRNNAITVDRTVISKDASVRAFGAGGPIVGSRLDIIVLDDVLDFDNTATDEQCAKIVRWFDTTVYTRLPVQGGGRIWCIGTPWNVNDLLHVLKERPAWGFMVSAAVLNPRAPQSEWRALWPEVVSADELRERCANMTPHAFARTYLCQVMDDAMRRFQAEWIQTCLDLGRGRGVMDRAPVRFVGGPLLPCFSGCDLGVGQDEDHDLSCIFTIGLDDRGKRVVLWVDSGRWTGPEIIYRLQWTYHRFNSIIGVESNAAQDYIRQFAVAGADPIPVVPLITGANKRDEAFGIESLAVELRAGMWVIPSNNAGEANDSEVRAWIGEMGNYRPHLHTGDRLMASWFARELVRTHSLPVAQRHDMQYR